MVRSTRADVSGFARDSSCRLVSVSNVLLHQSVKSLLVAFATSRAPLVLDEVGQDRLNELWLRGGFPDSFQAESDRASLGGVKISCLPYLERDIPALGPHIPATTLRRFWTMLADAQEAY